MKLYPHQPRAVEFLQSSPRACLYDDQGLGKTISAIAALPYVEQLRVLVLAPSVVAWNWKAELAAWLPAARIQVLNGLRDKVSSRADVVIVTHRQLIAPRIWRQLTANSWTHLIVDEAHYFCSPSSQRSRALFGPARPCALVDRAANTWLLTGTPAPNESPAELWTTLHGLWPEEFPESYERFRVRYCELDYSPWTVDKVKVVGSINEAELRQRMKGKFLRRLKDRVLSLPALRVEQLHLRPEKMPQELVQLSKRIELELADAADPVEAFRMLGESTDFARWRRISGLAKVEPVVELVAGELRSGRLPKVVIMAWHRAVISRIATELAPYGATTLTGDVLPKERTARVRRFQTDPKCRVIVCQLRAGGVGVTLTAAAEVVFAELSFAPGDNAQAGDRVRRIGQKRPVRFRYVALEGTVDEALTTVLRRKAAMSPV